MKLPVTQDHERYQRRLCCLEIALLRNDMLALTLLSSIASPHLFREELESFAFQYRPILTILEGLKSNMKIEF